MAGENQTTSVKLIAPMPPALHAAANVLMRKQKATCPCMDCEQIRDVAAFLRTLADGSVTIPPAVLATTSKTEVKVHELRALLTDMPQQADVVVEYLDDKGLQWLVPRKAVRNSDTLVLLRED